MDEGTTTADRKLVENNETHAGHHLLKDMLRVPNICTLENLMATNNDVVTVWATTIQCTPSIR